MEYQINIKEELKKLGIENVNSGVCTGTVWKKTSGKVVESFSPSDGEKIATVQQAGLEDYREVIETAKEAFKSWQTWPAPKRGEIVRQIGLELRKYKEPLGKLVSYEMGKIYQEGLGEVQEMIDICDFAVGQSRQLYGFTMHSERPKHRMYDQYHPLGIVGVELYAGTGLRRCGGLETVVEGVFVRRGGAQNCCKGFKGKRCSRRCAQPGGCRFQITGR
jgi:aldehyde dehydrogenase (NAD+)